MKEDFSPASSCVQARRADEKALYRRKCQRNSAANRHLKELAGRAGIEKRVMVHFFRNAAAWKLYHTDSNRVPNTFENVGDIYKVSKFLGR